MTSEEDWAWTFTPRATDQFDGLDPHVQDRIISKLDDVVDSEWRDPDDFLEPLTSGPFSKPRIGQYRLASSSITRYQFSKSTESSIEAEPIPTTTDETVGIRLLL